MKTILKAITWVTDGKASMAPQKRNEVTAFYERFADRNIEVVFRVLPRRSLKENKYYWGCVIPLVREGFEKLGNELDDEMTHDFLKARFNSVHLVGVGGELLGTVGDTTTQLNNEEFYEGYIAKIKQFASEYLEVYIPEPNEQSTLQFESNGSNTN